MTNEEHMLIVVLLARQSMQIRALVKLLQQHELVDSDSVKLFLECELEVTAPETIERMAILYESAATKLGLDVRLQDFGKPT